MIINGLEPIGHFSHPTHQILPLQTQSMAREDRRQAMVEALEGLRGLLNENDRVNVIGFSRTPRLLAEAMNGKQGQLADLLNIEANEGGTNLEEALKLGEQLAERHQLEGALTGCGDAAAV